jgi:hypothetical protein
MIAAVDESAKSYFQAIEQRFIERRGRALLLSPADVRRVADWHREGVPLEAVLEGVDLHFDRMQRRGREPRRAVTLAFCEDDVHDAWAGVKQRRLGARTASATAAAEGPSLLDEHARLLAALRAARDRAVEEGRGVEAGAIERALGTLEGKAELFDAARADHDPQRTEDHLRRLERSLDRALREAAGEESILELTRAVESDLAEKRSRMKDATWERVREQLVSKRLRERHALPRLSLFYT